MATSTNWIRLPETKPATEWLLGGPVQKVTPKFRHARAQLLLASAFDEWGAGRGFAATEWHVYPAMPGEAHRPFVPDVAFVPRERLAGLSEEEREEPGFTPDIVVEVRSPDDRQRYLDHKIEVYLATGALLVLVVDPIARSIIAHARDGTRRFHAQDVFEHAAMPEFRLDLQAFFHRVNLDAL